MRACTLLLCLGCGVAACRERDVPAPPPRATVAPPVASASVAAPPEIRPEQLQQDAARGLRVRSGTFSARPSWGFSELSLDFSQIRLEIAATGRGEQLAKLLPERALAVINGGYFETDFRPS